MANRIAEGIRSAGVEVDVRKCTEVEPADLLKYDGIIFGSPTYYGVCAAEMKSLIDRSIKYHGKLRGKVGGAFASCGVLGGGCETTVAQLLEACLIHGMIVMGDPDVAHYGPVSIEKPNKKVEKVCIDYGRRLAELTKKLRG